MTELKPGMRMRQKTPAVAKPPANNQQKAQTHKKGITDKLD